MFHECWRRMYGCKTYSVSILTIIGAIITVVTALMQHQMPDLNTALSLIMPAIMAMTIRHGISTEIAKGNS